MLLRRRLAGRPGQLRPRPILPARGPGRQGLLCRQMDPLPDRRHPKPGARAQPGLGQQPLATGQHHGPGKIAARWRDYVVGVPYLDDD